MKYKPTFRKEKNYWSQGYACIAGVDEVGRGCLAGPVVAGAVIFAQNHKRISGITDSKQLSKKQRLELAPLIFTYVKESGIGIASAQEINQMGIVPATFLAMERALLQLSTIDVILVDGSLVPRLPHSMCQQIETIIKGDQLSYSIAAASIIAKVHRDQLMEKLSTFYPNYKWEQNVGYGTAQHRKAIAQFGLVDEHRHLFCRKALQAVNNL